ncbi:hypothetical protein CC80DRAFT_491359 [Byssothecium circinans]|uniref:non-specific serine/threonine protein kinase n=1 Tax=Byssothecium circinans TaxID=147558 RepID=A0A6A5U195_9PLEO|nr:hypothetical protein CC80DRAFT_491359 [Byssothecium circinans]
MPPKQVYGRRTTTKSVTTFAKFISPDKEVFVGERRKNAARPEQTPAKDEIEAIGDGLVGLCLGNDKENKEAEKDEESVVKVQKKRGRPRKDGGKDVRRPEVEDLAAEMELLGLNEKKADNSNQRTQRKKKTPRKAFGSMEHVNAKKKNRIPREQSKEAQKHADEQTALLELTTPLRDRRLQAVVVPKAPSSPVMARLPTPELTPDATPEPDDIYTTYVSPLLSQSYGKRIITFEEWSSALEPHFQVSKIAEASFSEVYRLSSISTTSSTSNESVLKLVGLKTLPDAPLPSQSQGRKVRDPSRQAKADMKARKERDLWKSHVADVHSEVKLLQNLNHIPGFTNFREVTVLQGRPTAMFVDAWKAWNKSRPKGKKSEFPDPSKKTSYDDTQLWAVVEMQDAGTDCEKVMEAGGISTVWEVWDVFWGVCLSVAKAEEVCKFEHRDLHLENICIRSSRSQSEDDLTRPIIQDPLRRKLGFTGLDTTVIDYTLSRAEVSPFKPSDDHSLLLTPRLTPSSSATPPPTEPEVAYLDLDKDMGLFNGDASEEYQYEIYRYMRGVAVYNDPLQTSPPTPISIDTNTPRRSPRKQAQVTTFDDFRNPELPPSSHPRRSPRKSMTGISYAPPSDIWRSFHPKTNLVWAHFILFKLLEHLEGGEPTALTPKQVMRNVAAKPEETAKVVRKATRLFSVLEKVAGMLEPRVLGSDGALGSVKELVVLALEERWLRVGDVAGG